MRFSINPNIPQRLVAFELNDVEWGNRLNKPGAFVGFVAELSNDVETLVPAPKKRSKSGRDFRGLFLEFSESHLTQRTKSQAIKIRHDTAVRMAEAGYSVNANLASTHRIYVVELSSNPLAGDTRHAVYVGQTSKDPNERIRQHQSGTSNSLTSRFMTNRRTDLEPGDDYLSHSTYNAEVLEVAWGRVLESRGFRVFGPTGFSTRKKSRTV